MDYFTAADGARLAYRDEGTGRPILFLHGMMAHGGFFREQAALAADFRLIRLDLRGHGASATGPTPPTIGLLAQDVAGLADALDLEGAIGVGWSLGAAILWHVLAGPAGGRFAGAVVIDMTARVRNDGDWTLGLSPEAIEARSVAIDEDFRAFAQSAGEGIFAQPAASGIAELARWAGSEFARSDRDAIAAVWASLVDEDARALLGRITQPTLVVHGAHSSLYGAATADHLVAQLGDARVVRFAGSGHAPHLEQPELFNATLRDFADRLSHAAATPETQIQGG